MPKVLWEPNPGPQTKFLRSKARETFYGGAAGGGKSDALIVLPLSRVHHPKHHSILLRRTFPNLLEMSDRMRDLYEAVAPGARFNEKESRWHFPSGAIVQLGHAEHEADIRGYKSFEFDLICFDELTTFTEEQYTFMFSRNRTKSRDLPPLMRSASNPGDIGHEWVFERFIDGKEPFEIYNVEIKDPVSGILSHMTRQFIPAKVWDNPKMPMMGEYITGLMNMGEDDAMAYLHGLWTVFKGQMFKKLPRVVEAKPKSDDYYVIRAMDYGYEDYTCVLWLYCYPDNQIEVASEMYVNHTTVEGLAAMVHVFEERLDFPRDRLRWSVGDPAMFKKAEGQNISYQMGQHDVWLTPANNDRIAGWAQLRNLIETNRLSVWEGQAPNLMRTLPAIRFHPKKVNDAAPYQEDHACDTLRYGSMVFYEQPPADPGPPPVNPNQDTYFDELRDIVQGKGRHGDKYGEFFNGTP